METIPDRYAANAQVFKAFCDENRLRVLELLQSGEKCACVLLEKLEISQSTLSHHMKILTESRVVNARKEGKWTYYAISGEGAETARNILSRVLERFESGCGGANGDCLCGR